MAIMTVLTPSIAVAKPSRMIHIPPITNGQISNSTIRTFEKVVRRNSVS
jgi:hypothetical protein